jgi:hypothetical protein
MVATGFSNRPINNPYAHPNALTELAQWLQHIATLIPIDHLKTWLVDHNFVMDQPKLVDNEAVGQSLTTEVVINELLMGPGPSVSTGTEQSVKLGSRMQTNLKAKKRRCHTVVTTLFSPTNQGQCSL